MTITLSITKANFLKKLNTFFEKNTFSINRDFSPAFNFFVEKGINPELIEQEVKNYIKKTFESLLILEIKPVDFFMTKESDFLKLAQELIEDKDDFFETL